MSAPNVTETAAAHVRRVWGAFGDVANYVEPFAGSLAVLLCRPHAPRVETVNDLDCYLANFWRAVQQAPEEVARFADWPVNEADLHARHRWLVGQEEFRRRIRTEPDFFDAKVAGGWVWGLCQWIGGSWCASSNWGETRRAAGDKTANEARRPALTGSMGVLHAKRPMLGKGGNGVQRHEISEKLPNVSSGFGNGSGVHRVGLHQQIPQLGGDSGAAGRGVHASGKSLDAIVEWMLALADRLRRVRVCCGDWRRVLGRSATECIGVTGVFLDPPYGLEAGRDPSLYAEESLSVAADVREWALEHGSNKKLLIALCGYEGEHDMPKSWQCVEWKAAGGYAGAAGNVKNAGRERIWFSPHCARAADQAQLFASGADR